MKKIVFMLGVAAMAAGAQAAAFQWTSSNAAYGIAAATLAALTDGTTYDAATSGTANRMVKQTSIAWAYELVLTGATTSDTLNGTPVFSSTGKVNHKGGDVLGSDLVVAGDSLHYDIVFTGTYTDANQVEWTLTSNTISGDWAVNSQGDIILDTATPSKWTATKVSGGGDSSDIPEPTSGLLMLVGLGALALRRRRA